MGKSMGRKILAVVAFNIYALFLVSAFQENTAYLFDASLIQEMKLSGLDVDPREWGWGDHYIWRLFAAVIVTAIVGFLAGAIAKGKGGIVASVANIPSVLIWGGMIYLFGFSGIEVEAGTGFIVISIIAIPLTTYIAYIAGSFGEEIQRQEYSEETVLGVKGYHWIWAVFPLYWYSLGIVFVGAKFIGVQFATWSDTSIFASLLSIAMLIPIIAWIYPLRVVHRILMGDILATHNVVVKGIANFGVLIGGIILATGIQVGIYWLLSKMLT